MPDFRGPIPSKLSVTLLLLATAFVFASCVYDYSQYDFEAAPGGNADTANQAAALADEQEAANFADGGAPLP